MKTYTTTRIARPDGLDAGPQDWPTTQRFSRRLGETHRDMDYARAIEPPEGWPGMDSTIAALRMLAAYALAVLAAFMIVVWGGGSA